MTIGSDDAASAGSRALSADRELSPFSYFGYWQSPFTTKMFCNSAQHVQKKYDEEQKLIVALFV